MLRVQASKLKWKDLSISPFELRLNSLRCGQSFRWKQIQDNWISVLHGRLVVLKETPSSILYGYQDTLHQDAVQDIKDYFQLDRVSLEACYSRWSALDSNFAKKALQFQGIRMLRQDPWENLISFICSSNNNIARITQMIDKLCSHYGQKIGEYEDQSFYEFPTLDALTDPSTESTLRQLGFGYRAKFIANAAKKLKEDHPDLGEKWLYTLRDVSYSEAKEALMEFQGVGPKVADCVCLMSLDHSESIPVDTHVWQIALRDYGFKSKKVKTLNQKLYVEVGDHFRVLFGDYSGWAHSVLFTADLKGFEKKTVEKRKVSIDDVKVEEQITIKEKRIKKEEE
ncbi:N-glycosylase/DNA lyase [Choanephora cucurbitarum]|uniref:N-glycosylase/DNA lyase n=1 Tax=Choanephora cucurbitarum TaxID=101091 RepID=A0A1C7NFF4_9FUNG|nr:N-glycosylase/DNA lyase [Choanephora cucurbitarum]